MSQGTAHGEVKKHLQYSHKKYELKSLTEQAASYCLYTKVKLKIDISSLYSIFFFFFFSFYKGICPLPPPTPTPTPTPLFLLSHSSLNPPEEQQASPFSHGWCREPVSCQPLGCCVLSRVRWRQGWSRIWLRQRCLTVSGTHRRAHGCPADCYCCLHCHWVVPANCSALCLLAPGTAVKRSCRARIEGARDLLMLTPRQMLRLLLPLPCCNAAGGKTVGEGFNYWVVVSQFHLFKQVSVSVTLSHS